jgi:hypothetical protein
VNETNKGTTTHIYARDIERITGRHRNSVRRWFLSGKLKGQKLGEGPTCLWYTTREDLEKFINRPLTEAELTKLA